MMHRQEIGSVEVHMMPTSRHIYHGVPFLFTTKLSLSTLGDPALVLQDTYFLSDEAVLIQTTDPIRARARTQRLGNANAVLFSPSRDIQATFRVGSTVTLSAGGVGGGGGT